MTWFSQLVIFDPWSVSWQERSLIFQASDIIVPFSLPGTLFSDQSLKSKLVLRDESRTAYTTQMWKIKNTSNWPFCTFHNRAAKIIWGRRIGKCLIAAAIPFVTGVTNCHNIWCASHRGNSGCVIWRIKLDVMYLATICDNGTHIRGVTNCHIIWCASLLYSSDCYLCYGIKLEVIKCFWHRRLSYKLSQYLVFVTSRQFRSYNSKGVLERKNVQSCKAVKL